VRRISVSENGLWGIGEDTRDYLSDWKERIADYYLVNTTTGQRTLILKAQGLTFGLSPDSKNFLFWKDKDFWIYKIESGETLNLTERAPVSFIGQTDDHPGVKPPYGVAGWTKDGDSVILNHQHDLWLQSLDGGRPTCLTAGLGEKEEILFRYVRLDSERKTIDLSRSAILAAYGSWTKKEGFYELSKGRLKKLVYADEHFDGLLKAKASDRMMYTRENFAKFPDYYVSDSSFSNPRRVTDANPWLFEYKWGSRFIFEFRNKDGRRLQGTLAVPEDRQPDQRLPMIVNFYEKKSQDSHRFPLPLYSNPPQYSVGYPAGNIGPVAEFGAYVSNGYLVMQPDIYFNTRTTHDDMLDCVEAATRKVIDLGYADEARIALGGGSFSGGGSAFIAARSKLFVCVVARAATINL